MNQLIMSLKQSTYVSSGINNITIGIYRHCWYYNIGYALFRFIKLTFELMNRTLQC